MARLNDKPIERQDLVEYLESHDDFQFELDVFRLCLAGGAERVEHGGTYQDPITKKDRQFDIRMLVRKGQLIVRLAIECKNLKPSHPLLVSRIPRRVEESFHEIILSRPRPQYTLMVGSTARRMRVQAIAGIFETKRLVGKSTTQVGRSLSGDLITGDAEVFEKWSQAIASAFDLVAEADEDYKITGTPAGATFVIPVLVVADGSLWAVDYSEDGIAMTEPTPTDSCEILLGKEIWTAPMGIGYTFSHLLVFTKGKFDGYLNRLVTNDLYWDRIFPAAALEGTAIIERN